MTTARAGRLTPRLDPGLAVALAAFDFPVTRARPGDEVRLTFYWVATQPMPNPGCVFVHFYGPSGALYGQADKPDPVIFRPTTRWELRRVRKDEEVAVLKVDAPPGVYTVAVGLWERSTGRRSHPLDSNGQPIADEKLILTEQFVVAP